MGLTCTTPPRNAQYRHLRIVTFWLRPSTLPDTSYYERQALRTPRVPCPVLRYWNSVPPPVIHDKRAIALHDLNRPVRHRNHNRVKPTENPAVCFSVGPYTHAASCPAQRCGDTHSRAAASSTTLLTVSKADLRTLSHPAEYPSVREDLGTSLKIGTYGARSRVPARYLIHSYYRCALALRRRSLLLARNYSLR